jgi:hypothetical protein
MSTITDIELEARDLCDANTTSYPAATMLRRVNYGYEQVIAWIINADGTWQFDDTNYTNFPIGTYTLVNGQSKYSFNDKFLQLEEVQILNAGGQYEIIQSIDQKEYDSYQPLSEQYSTSGKPIYYDKVADDTVELFPAPDNGVSVTLAAGLKIKFKRTASLFTAAQVTTGTKEPGFASPFHVILSYMAAIPYCMTYKKDRVALYEKRVEELKRDILNHYGTRQKDIRKVMTMSQTPYR